MRLLVRVASYALLAGLLAWLGWYGYSYFFDTNYPTVRTTGLDENSYYAGDIAAVISGNHSFSVADISVHLDGRPLITKFKINKKEFDHPFTISTRALTNGKHTLHVEANDGTFGRHTAEKDITFFVDNTPLQVAFVRAETDYKVLQGRTLHVQFQANKEIQEATIQALSKQFKCYPESPNSLIYEAFVPVPCEEKANEYLLSINIADKVGNTTMLENKFNVVAFPFKKQTLTVSAEVAQAQKEGASDEVRFEQEIERLTLASLEEKYWQGSFETPIEIKGISTDFGTVRTTQEKGRYMHKALDVLNTPRSVVWSSQKGKIVVKDTFAHSGNTVVIDHGLGVLSMYFHLDTFGDIEVGDMVKKGKKLGTLGKTGYASGYHLHWELRVGNIPVDPMQWTKANF